MTDTVRVPATVDGVTLTIDGIDVTVPQGTLIIRAAEHLGIQIPRFCDHPLLDPVGACRQCLVEIPDGGNGRAMKPTPACTQTVAPGMAVKTSHTSAVARKEQQGMLEFLLINHPLDCPICDKGGECPLQNQAMSNGRGESRYEGVKRTFPKPVALSVQILLDRERCVLCQRCTRFSAQISGDDHISLAERGAKSQIAIDPGQPYDSYFSGNVVQICPVGALTSADYRFRARPFDLVSTSVTCENCASGCQLRTDHRRFQVQRRLAGNLPEVNEAWNCDKGRFGFRYGQGADRLTGPLVRRGAVLVPASWPEAIAAAVRGLQAAGVASGVLTGGRLTNENAVGYAAFASRVLGTANIDCRARALSAEETDFLASQVAGRSLEDSVTYTDLENAKRVVLVCFEPEDESPMVFLRLRKAWHKRRLEVLAVAPFSSNGSRKMGATLIPTVPGDEAFALAQLGEEGRLDPDTIILVGERAATSAGTLSEVVRASRATGARFAWVPRRAGEIGAIDAGCLPAVGALDTDAMLAAAARGELKALVVAGVELADLADPAAARDAFDRVGFLVSLEQRHSAITELADVVLPVALIEEQIGTFDNWEHRHGEVALVNPSNTAALPDVRVLAMLADALGSPLGFDSPAQVRAAEAKPGGSPSAPAPDVPAGVPQGGAGLLLASWRLAVDSARSVDHAEALAASAPPAQVKVSPRTAADLGLVATATLANDEFLMTLPVEIVADMVDDVVWAPANSGAHLTEVLHAAPGARVQLTAGGAA